MKFERGPFAESEMMIVRGGRATTSPGRGLWRPPRVLGRLIFLSVLFSQCSYGGQLSVDEILKKVSDTYQNLQSYRFVAEQHTQFVAVGSIEGGIAAENAMPGSTISPDFHKEMVSQIELAEIRPRKLRLMVKDSQGEFLLVSDGQTTWTYLPKLKQYTEELRTPSEATDESRAAEKGEKPNLSEYRSLLVNRFRGLSKYGSITTLGRENQIKVGGVKIDCYVVKIQTPQLMHEFWVDKERFIVLRSKRTPLRPQEGIAMQTTITVNTTEATVNTQLADSLFKFTPPEKATKVQSLNYPSKSR